MKTTGMAVVASLLFLICSCAERGITVVRSIPEARSLDCVERGYDPLALGISGYVKVGDYWLVTLLASDGGNDAYAVVDSSGNELCRIGKRGRGPFEMLYPSLQEVVCVSPDSLRLRILDSPTGKVYLFSADLRNGTCSAELELDFGGMMREVHGVGDGRYLCNGESNRYYFTDSSGSKEYLEYWGDDINEAVEGQAWYNPEIQTTSCISGDSSRIYIYGGRQPVIYEHDINGERLNTVYFGMDPKEVENMKMGMEYHGFYDVRSIGGNILACYYDFEYDSNKPVEDCYTSYIIIFNRKFQPLARYKVPYIQRCWLDQKTGKLITLNFSDEMFRTYDLSEWL